MKWREFLKPDLKKVIAFIILLIIGFGLNYLDHSVFFLNPLKTIIKGIPCPGGYCSSVPGDLLIGTIMLIIYYLLSCFIVYIYQRYKK